MIHADKVIIEQLVDANIKYCKVPVQQSFNNLKELLLQAHNEELLDDEIYFQLNSDKYLGAGFESSREQIFEECVKAEAFLENLVQVIKNYESQS